MQAMPLTAARVSAWLPRRQPSTYKGDYGYLLLIGGNETMGGAIQMAGQAAVYGGAGVTTIATAPVNRPAIHSALPEAMVIDWMDAEALRQALIKTDVLALGPGMGRSLSRWVALQRVLREYAPRTVIIDGDALFFYSQCLQQGKSLFAESHVIVTPHLGEWRTLTAGQIALTDEEAITRWVNRNRVILVLKGAPTRLFAPDTPFFLQNTTGNPGQATGGMGDTLVGTIAALAGQIKDPLKAAGAGVYLHSATADVIYQEQYVVVPTQLAHRLPFVMKQLTA